MTKLTTRKSTSTRLTDTQLIVLSRAAQREDGAATLPDGMTEKAAQKLAATLVEKAARSGNQGEAWHARMEAQRGGALPCADHHQARPDCDQGRGRSRIGGYRALASRRQLRPTRRRRLNRSGAPHARAASSRL